jgi:hypothetical protein
MIDGDSPLFFLFEIVHLHVAIFVLSAHISLVVFSSVSSSSLEFPEIRD